MDMNDADLDPELSDLERELQRVLRTRNVPSHGPAGVPDSVPAVHAGIRRRRRTQRAQVLIAGAAVVAVAVGASTLAGGSLTGQRPDTRQPATGGVVPRPDGGPVPPGFQVQDLSFLSITRGWALGTATCATGRCSSLLMTQDGGTTWVSRPAPAADVRNLRFVADSGGRQVGYAFNPGLALTTDGGRSWTTQPVQGQVVGLEAARGNVVRLVTQQAACPGCSFVLQRSDIAGSVWQTVDQPAYDRGVSGSLLRQGTRLVALLRGHTSGGASDARSRLVLSTDNGDTWRAREDPCGPASMTSEVDATQVSIAADGGVVALCAHRGQPASFTRYSTDGARTFHAARDLPAGVTASLLISPRRVVMVASTSGTTGGQLLRSTDDGASWNRAASQPGAGESAFLDFTTDEVGTWIGPDRTRVLRTTDAGATWTEQPFS